MSVSTLALALVVSLGPSAQQDRGQVEPPAPHVAEDGQLRRRHLHLQLDSDATWGIGSQMFLGTHVRLAGMLEHWSTTRATGTWDFALGFAYQNEPTFLAPWIDPTQVKGAGHRTQLTLGVGHSFHMGARRRFALGLHVLGGWNYARTDYEVTYATEGVQGSEVVDFHRPLLAGELRMTYRLHRRVGLNMMISAPIPTDSTYLISLAQVGLGLSLYLR